MNINRWQLRHVVLNLLMESIRSFGSKCQGPAGRRIISSLSPIGFGPETILTPLPMRGPRTTASSIFWVFLIQSPLDLCDYNGNGGPKYQSAGFLICTPCSADGTLHDRLWSRPPRDFNFRRSQRGPFATKDRQQSTQPLITIPRNWVHNAWQLGEAQNKQSKHGSTT